MSETMVERVARAIFFQGGEQDDLMWKHTQSHRRETAIVQARAAIEAMMPPTEAMLKAAAALKSPCVKYSTLYNSMIRAALATLPGEE